MLLRMAWRSLLRSKRRTGITVFSVAFGVWLAATFTALADDSHRNMIDSSARLGFGHASVEPLDYRSAPGFDRWVPDAVALARQAETHSEVERTAVRVFGQAMFATARKSVGGLLYGINPTAEDPDINIYLANLVEGNPLETANGRGVVVGQLLAAKLGLKLGRKLVYTIVDSRGELVSAVARVRGIYRTGVDDVDGSVVLLPIDRVRELLGYTAQDASVVSIYLSDHRAADRVARELDRGLESVGVTASTWATTQPEMAGIVRLDAGINQLFQLLVGVLIAAGVLNTLLMSVLERKKEFGVMMALGTSPSTLFRLVMLESSLVGAVGLILGTIALVPWLVYLKEFGVDTTGATGDDFGVAGVLVDPILRATVYGESMAVIGAAVFALTLAAGLYPAWRAGRQAPVEAIKVL